MSQITSLMSQITSNERPQLLRTLMSKTTPIKNPLVCISTWGLKSHWSWSNTHLLNHLLITIHLITIHMRNTCKSRASLRLLINVSPDVVSILNNQYREMSITYLMNVSFSYRNFSSHWMSVCERIAVYPPVWMPYPPVWMPFQLLSE